MFKFRRLLCVVLVCALVGVAYGAANKIRKFTPQGSELATADGMAILNFAQGSGGIPGSGSGNWADSKTIFHIAITGFTPFTTYDVKFDSPTQGTTYNYAILVTDENGDAQFKGSVPGIDVSDSSLSIYVNLSVAGEELRAIGLQ